MTKSHLLYRCCLAVPSLASFALLLLVCSCTNPDYRVGYAEATVPPDQNVIKEGDVLQIVFPGATNLSVVQRVPLDGDLRLQFVGQLKAVGKTPEQLQQDLLNAYGPQLQLKEASVNVISSSASVYLSGAVLRPGRVPLERNMTVLEAIMEGGGFASPRARVDRVVVIRYENQQQTTYRLNLKRALEGNETQPFYVKPFDIIHVPAKKINL